MPYIEDFQESRHGALDGDESPESGLVRNSN